MRLVIFGASGLLGTSAISMEDFAIAMLDEAEDAKHPRQRFTAAH